MFLAPRTGFQVAAPAPGRGKVGGTAGSAFPIISQAAALIIYLRGCPALQCPCLLIQRLQGPPANSWTRPDEDRKDISSLWPTRWWGLKFVLPAPSAPRSPDAVLPWLWLTLSHLCSWSSDLASWFALHFHCWDPEHKPLSTTCLYANPFLGVSILPSNIELSFTVSSHVRYGI